jgi:cytochrome b6-f complex iron-sulfur subunit
VIRPHEETSTSAGGLISRIKRRQLLRLGFLGGTLLALTEISVFLVPFLRVNKIIGLGAAVPAGQKADILAKFGATNDAPIVNTEGKFFLMHAPGGIIAVYRKCTHLGCTVPFNASEDQLHCPCHGSLYDKHTAIVKGGPAPRPLDLFHIKEQNGVLIVDTNPLTVIMRSGNEWNPKDLEVTA